MINTQEAISLFHQHMQSKNQWHVLRLVGEAKMGKSHLLSKVFPILARQDYHARCALLDLRNPTHTVPDILHFTCGQLGGQTYDSYYAAYREWLNRPKKVGVQQLIALFSRITIAVKDSSSDIHQRDLHLTTQFVKDLSNLDDQPILLLFDTVNKADEYIQIWLMDTLLVQLSQLAHVRVVVAGRSVPEASNSYATSCQSYQLSPVTEVDAYIDYCQNANLTLSEQSIRDFARAFRYTPGIFVEYVLPNFV